jgi:hypothetical protein
LLYSNFSAKFSLHQAKGKSYIYITACSFGWWLVLICAERKVLLAGCWWLVYSERKVLLAGG